MRSHKKPRKQKNPLENEGSQGCERRQHLGETLDKISTLGWAPQDPVEAMDKASNCIENSC